MNRHDVVTRGRLVVLSCVSGRPFADRIVMGINHVLPADYERLSLSKSDEVVFANNEVKGVIRENIRGADVYVVQAIADPRGAMSVNDNLMALLTMVNAARNSDADTITAVLPHFPYSRQERKKGREPISAKLVSQFLEAAGADRVITMDIHSEAIEGFFNRAKLENLHASYEIIAYLSAAFRLTDLIVVSPDVGSADRGRFFSQAMKADFAIIDKARDYSSPSAIASMRLVGSVEGRNVFIADDLISTGTTLLNACALLREHGAREIVLSCTHPFFNGNAVVRFDQAHAEGLVKAVIGTDSVPRDEGFRAAHPWYHEVSVAGLFARCVYNINRKLSVSSLLKSNP